MRPEFTPNQVASFWNRVTPQNERGCRLWIGTPHPRGYGTVTLNHTRYLAHRLAWILENGPIPGDLRVLHECDVRRCCEPTHLFLGTNADNTADMVAKGRSALGERNGCAKLTQAQVDEIRLRYRGRGRGETQVALAAAFGVSYSLISMIVHHKRWP